MLLSCKNVAALSVLAVLLLTTTINGTALPQDDKKTTPSAKAASKQAS